MLESLPVSLTLDSKLDAELSVTLGVILLYVDEAAVKLADDVDNASAAELTLSDEYADTDAEVDMLTSMLVVDPL